MTAKQAISALWDGLSTAKVGANVDKDIASKYNLGTESLDQCTNTC